MIISATTRANAPRLSKSASTVHTVFRIPAHDYSSVLPEPNPILTKLKNADVIFIDEMLMMNSNRLCAVDHCFK